MISQILITTFLPLANRSTLNFFFLTTSCLKNTFHHNCKIFANCPASYFRIIFNRHFSCVTIRPRSFTNTAHSSGSLRAAYDASIPTCGTITVSFHVDLVISQLHWTFIVADHCPTDFGRGFSRTFRLPF